LLTLVGVGRNPIRGSPFTESALSPTIGYRRTDGDRRSRPSRPVSGTATPVTPIDLPRGSHSRTLPLPADFKFPPALSSANEPCGRSHPPPSPQASNNGILVPGAPPKLNTRDTPSISQQSHLAPATKIISNSSMNGSSRSSGEFYSLSNNSTETLESEYTSYLVNRSRPIHLWHARHYSNVEPVNKPRDSETLLMGYAQISASFTVDGSLISQAAFEEVKRKGVLGSPGHRAEEPNRGPKGRRSGGLWSALGWNTIEESINSLLSNNDLSGLRDMRGVTSSKSIPLLSTPQSLLFVDIRLASGEERSFSFAFTLPRGLPASHKGKAIKFSYHMVIGTQRPGGPKGTQYVNRINIPFRVFSGVNGKLICISTEHQAHSLQLQEMFLAMTSWRHMCCYETKQGSRR
jgi:RAB6A-GEF complex partner protein 2